MTVTRLTVALAFVLSMSGIALAAEAPARRGCRARAATRANARVETPVPPLKGRSAADITAAMIEYKSGKRAGTIMDRIAKGFSDEEIRAIAAWYAGQK